MYLSSVHIGTVWAKLISALNSMPKMRLIKSCKYNLYPLQGEKNQQTGNDQEESILRDIFILNLLFQT